MNIPVGRPAKTYASNHQIIDLEFVTFPVYYLITLDGNLVLKLVEILFVQIYFSVILCPDFTI